MKKIKFKEIFHFAPKSKMRADAALIEGDYPFYTSSSILEKRIDTAQYHNEALVFGNGGTASIHYANTSFSTSSHCFVAIKKEENVNIKFVYYYLFGNIEILERGFKGAGLKNISPKYIEETNIPYPELSIQNKIVAALDKAISFINKRQICLRMTDELIRATYFNMFGDPYFNTKQFPTNQLENLCHFITKGTTPKGGDVFNEQFKGSVPFLKVYHIADDGRINFDYKPSYVTKAIHNSFLNRSKVFPNDILMNIVGPPLGKIGLVPDTYPEWNINQAMVIFRTKEILNPQYLLYTLKDKNLLQSIMDKAVGVRQQNLSLKQCREILIPVPPKKLQKKFETAAAKILKLNVELNISLITLNSLFKSIVQKAFKGELNFNIDIELDALISKEDKNSIQGDVVYLQRLIDRLKEQEFENKEIYDKAKNILFAVLKEKKNISQEYSEEHQNINLSVAIG